MVFWGRDIKGTSDFYVASGFTRFLFERYKETVLAVCSQAVEFVSPDYVEDFAFLYHFIASLVLGKLCLFSLLVDGAIGGNFLHQTHC